MSRSANDIIRNLHETLRQLSFADPLMQRGIERDWVCVIHPAMVKPLTDEVAKMPPGVGRVVHGEQQQLAMITGRKTYIIPAAQPGALEYMPEAEMYKRYAEYFMAVVQLAAIRGDASDDAEVQP